MRVKIKATKDPNDCAFNLTFEGITKGKIDNMLRALNTLADNEASILAEETALFLRKAMLDMRILTHCKVNLCSPTKESREFEDMFK